MTDTVFKNELVTLHWLADGKELFVFPRDVVEVGDDGYVFVRTGTGKLYVRESVEEARAAIAKATA